ncbi:Polyphosphoinositide phosphatase [Teratosphaeria nubilosa]|uniref:Polyphosphoinositide phosphatase n=1 Tax=Teratosphaeria nubilosa TaxID=161662 RepID=A0A6G1KW88_9PEZI|nr:Polyphosphoinositide phosphatase [Teratosphaeria nubilosa]
MDHLGPVDAGPNADRQYHNQYARPGSPDQARYESAPPKKSSGGLRSASTKGKGIDRASNAEATGTGSADGVQNGGGVSASEHSTTRSRHPSLSSQSAGSFDEADFPVIQQVGATAEQLTGEMAFDDADLHLRELPLSQRVDGTNVHAEQQQRPHRMFKFTLYETNARYWITGSDIMEKSFRLLRIDRTSPPGQIALFEDETVYDRKQMNEILTSIDEGNRTTGGLKMKNIFWGLLGFIRFTEAYYMLIITKRQQVAVIGGHYVYQIEATELVPLSTGPSSRFMKDRNPEELRFLSILGNLDLSKSFYFSYSYDITHSLQTNIIRQRQALHENQRTADPDFNAMFVWNHHLLKPAMSALKHPFDWCLPIIHGFIDQASLDVFGRSVYITIIGRRSRFFAGARFLKRGVNDLGYVANDVETEQIVAEKMTTSFHAPGPRLYANPTYTSYLHQRGSIPLYWTQDNSGVTPKPDIDLNLSDPFYQPAALHFDNLFERYGCPIYVLNLIKSRERTPRESKLLVEFENCVKYLNQSLPTDKKITYKAFDMSRASKTRGGDVIGSLETIARDILDATGFFHNGELWYEEPQVQNGVARTNCIDCLDRTNAAQFVVGKHAFARQLKALGVFDGQEVDYDTDAVNVFTNMFHDHGDTIAVQYGGSHLVNTMATYRKLNQWQSHSRDMVESFKRYYHNSFLDSQRQEAYNLFLGNYIWAQGQPMLWDLTTDYYLHHSDPRSYLERVRRNYIYWFTPEFLEPRVMPPKPELLAKKGQQSLKVGQVDDYWIECYRPAALSSLVKVYSFRLNAENRFLPERPQLRDPKYDFSPFKVRLDPHRHANESAEKKAPRKGVKIMDPSDEQQPSTPTLPRQSEESARTVDPSHGILRESTFERSDKPMEPSKPEARPADKAQMHLWTLNQFHHQSLNPYVADAEAAEYEKYISHPLNLPLVVSNELLPDVNLQYLEYIHRAGGSEFDEYDQDATFADGISEDDLQHFWDFVDEKSDPLTVTEEDGGKKRYKAYRQWLRGKSLFKQSKVDPEYKAGL